MSLTALLNVVCILKEQATKTRNTVVGAQHQQRQIIRIMRLTAILLTAFCLQVAAGGKAQTLSLSLKNASMEKAFKEIEKQSGYSFIYLKENLQGTGTVNLVAKNETLETVLQKLFKDQPLTYTFSGNYIVVKQKSPNADAVISNESEKSPPIDVTGKVTDADGNPLSGATVKVKGTSKGTTTNNDGVFVLKGVDENATLEISFVGYETYTVAVNNKSTIVASLKIKPESLNEVVINKGYYTEKQRTSVSNVGRVNARDIEKEPINNVLLTLQGKTTGIFVEQANGLPGSGIKVKIQGQNSLRMGNDPFYVIDGVPYTAQLLPNLGDILGRSGSAAGNPMSFINPYDVESIEILKDADATAIYGSRAANGAILITTKKGSSGKTKVGVSVQSGWGKVTRKLDLLNTNQYLQMRREAKMNDNASILTTDYDINGFWDTTRYTDWQKVLIGNTARYSDAQASFSGGNALTQYLISSGYHRETTVFPGDLSDQKGSVHFFINNISLNQKFKIQLSGNYLVDNNQLIINDLTAAAMQLAPDAPTLYDANNNINWMVTSTNRSTWNNPLANLKNSYQNKTNNLVSNATLSYEIADGLIIKSNFGYTNIQSNEVQIYPTAARAPQLQFLQKAGIFGNNKISTWIIEPQANYNLTIKHTKLETLLGATIQQNNYNGEQLTGLGYNSDQVIRDIKSAANVTVNSSIISTYKYNAAFARIGYNIREKYIFNLTGRRDGSSRFGKENQFHNFYSIGSAWIFGDENFFKENLPSLSFGKIMASFGTTGNDQIGDYQFLNLYSPVSLDVPYQSVTGLQANGLSNPYLQWEETKKFRIGIALGFIKDRIMLNADYSLNHSSNQLLSYSLPVTTGFVGITRNFPATVQNSVWEFVLNSNNVKGNRFNWNSSFNLTIPKNKLTQFPNLSTSSYANDLFIGEPITVQLLYKYAGVNPNTGVYQFIDSHGNTSSVLDYSTDRIVHINPDPKYYGGFENSLHYKSLDLSFLFQFVKQLGANYFFGVLPGIRNANQPTYVLERWQKVGDSKPIQRFNSNGSLFGQSSNVIASSESWSDASYIRLKNVSLSWNFPEPLIKRAHFSRCQLFVQGQNLLTFTKYLGLDPETKSSITLPPLRILTIGTHLTF